MLYLLDREWLKTNGLAGFRLSTLAHMSGFEPPLGLPGARWDQHKELPFSVVLSLHKGKLQVTRRISWFPAKRSLAGREVCVRRNWNRRTKTRHRYAGQEDGTLRRSGLLFDMISAPDEDALNGMKVDMAGNLYAFGAEGLCILSTARKH